MARCGDALLWFDGHALAVIDYGPPMTLDGQTTLADDTSTRTGGRWQISTRPSTSTRAAAATSSRGFAMRPVSGAGSA